MHVSLKQNPVLIHSNDRSEDVMKSVLNFCFTQCIALLPYSIKYCNMIFLVISTPIVKWTYLSILTVWSCLVCWTVSSWVTGQRRGWGSYSQCMRMSWIRPCMPTSACSINRDSSLKILAASQRDFKMHQQVSLYCNWQCYIQFVWFWRYYQKRLVFEISSVWIVSQCEGMCMILKNEQKYW